MKKLDELDFKILSILQKDCRANFVTISKELGKSVTTVAYRLNRLFKMGIIKKCTAIADAKKLNLNYSAIIMGRIKPGKFAELSKFFEDHEEVQLAFAITGQYDFCLYAAFKDESAYFKFIEDLHKTECVTETTTFYIVKKMKEDIRVL
ncbi:MAG: Lrp/AsnC family transcriptional regulator [Crenarchaeota archaeon]|nr:Lrp/AsnC family transcriptional regulator [Thermoproteota archaeon]MCR8454398.1 Lrp/AsnC family transcriptional regulator [Thermoproteota archaeon]MCR8455479.1 Lrp/AsnC family transcriptional regulator [Thermoproteota archaeon]MCR8471938.1 Lrp/AsnC family transcriptional regulator [Thermoproteota archaeon]MCR8473720.1 Lrp/AsnC family transcriptional regulator [Thermoproteota archaeon]